jgi:hypothetical protein
MRSMRHSGRVLRPPGSAFPAGLLPDLWGFGAEKDLAPVSPGARREGARAVPAETRRPRDPIAGLIALIGKLFA